jgi:hypothetical protein
MPSQNPEALNSIIRCLEDRAEELEVQKERLQRLLVELIMENQQLRDQQQPK